MGIISIIIDKIKQSSMTSDEKEAELIFSGKLNKELTSLHKEILIVKRVTTEDMMQFSSMPYQLNCPVKKIINDGSHPFAYIDLNTFNKKIAENELNFLNEHIIRARSYIRQLATEYRIEIDIQNVAFEQYNKNYGYTRLMCTPHTFTGKISKYPLSLLFMTRQGIGYESSHGELFYNAEGKLDRAKVNIWNLSGKGWLFSFATIDSEFMISEVKSTVCPDKYGQPGVIYQCPKLVEEEKERTLNRKLYEWLQKNLPNDCPKTFSSFSRMKNANSKNYQALVQKAKSAGYVFPETLDDIWKLPENK